MTTLLLSRPPWVDHQTPLWHPERQDRMRAVESALEEESFAWLVREEAAEAALQMLALVHPEPYIQSLIDAAPLEAWSRSTKTRASHPTPWMPQCAAPEPRCRPSMR